jgi:hypothetical protein
MAFAFVASSVKVYPVSANTALRNCFEQVLEFGLTAVNTDAAFNLATLAGSDAVNGPAIVSLLDRVSKLTHCFVFESNRAAAAAGTAHTLTGTAAAPILTFAGGGTTPTALTVTLKFKLSSDREPIISNV